MKKDKINISNNIPIKNINNFNNYTGDMTTKNKIKTINYTDNKSCIKDNTKSCKQSKNDNSSTINHLHSSIHTILIPNIN